MKNVERLSSFLIQRINIGNEQNYILPLTGRIYARSSIFHKCIKIINLYHLIEIGTVVFLYPLTNKGEYMLKWKF